MHWKKLGRIFSVHRRSSWMVSHSAVSSAEHLSGDWFRAYFSTRDAKGRSHIGAAEFDIAHPGRIRNVARSPILAPGKLGAFDDSGAMPSCIVRTARAKRLYYVGWNVGITVPFRHSIGLAIGPLSGHRFHRYSDGPIIDRGPYEPYFASAPYVLREGSRWRMWYLSCQKWEMRNGVPKHWYRICYRESADGIDWPVSKTPLVCIDFRRGEYAIARPCVIRDSNRYRMWYSYRGRFYRIGYAESADGIKWKRKDDLAGIRPSKHGWDSESVEYPYVFDHENDRYMLYNGNGYGKTGLGLAVLA